jgi:hypothetical protein
LSSTVTDNRLDVQVSRYPDRVQGRVKVDEG